MARQPRMLSKVSVEAFARQLPDTPHLNTADAIEQLHARIDHINTFSIGRYFWFIADTTRFTHVEAGGSLEEMLPLKTDEFINAPRRYCFNKRTRKI